MQARSLRTLYNTMVPLVSLILFLSITTTTTTRGLSDSDAILKFKKSLVVEHANALATWNAKNPPCTWAGVLCNGGGFVWGLQLENLKLSGSIDIEALMGLTSLRTLSFMNNKFGGPFPEFKKLVALKSLYLSNNHFKGEIPRDAFEGLGWLKKLHLAHNKFSGEIPISIAKLPKLLELRLEGNQFTGQIPVFEHKLHMLNLSNNALIGLIPESLSMMDPKVFEGNKGLCGKPLERNCDSPSKQQLPQARHKSRSRVPLIITAVVMALTVLIILAVIILFNRNYWSKQPPLAVETIPSSLQKKTGIREVDAIRHRERKQPDHHHNGSRIAKKMATKSGAESTKLSFLREDREKFDLQDLLTASAEILGSGCFGASYKAVLSGGSVVMVVKRFKQMNNAGKDEFQEHMKRLGRLRHPNLLPLVAYYYRKEEKLLVCDFADNGSLAVNLHGHHALGKPSLDWPTRLKIVKGVARGLLYLHQDLSSLMAPHGHLKSSNVMLTKTFEPLLTDYGLIPVINQEKAQDHMVAYKSPEYLQYGRVTKKTDVWGLGVLTLEILTGKFPTIFLKGSGVSQSEDDLLSWVKLSFQGVWEPGLFDKEMGSTSHCEGQILKLLRIGLSCCEPDVEKRLDIREAVKKIEELKEQEVDDDDCFYSTYVSETDWRSSDSINLS